MPVKAVTLGADPEFILVNERTMEAITALEVPGTKDNPQQFKSLPPGYNFHRDNVLLEVGVPPQKTGYDLYEAVGQARRAANNWLSSTTLADGYAAIYHNADLYEFPEELLDNPLAQEFGCEPDQDAYEGGAARIAPDGILGNYRTAGGHVHIGTDTGEFNCPKFIVALLCDAYFGYNLPVVRPDTGAGFFWYRKPGLYRDKPYGIEYRSPSNNWTFRADGYHHLTRAEAVGKYARNTSAAKIRELIEKIDWVHVRAKMMGQVNENPEHQDVVQKTIGVYYG